MDAQRDTAARIIARAWRAHRDRTTFRWIHRAITSAVRLPCASPPTTTLIIPLSPGVVAGLRRDRPHVPGRGSDSAGQGVSPRHSPEVRALFALAVRQTCSPLIMRSCRLGGSTFPPKILFKIFVRRDPSIGGTVKYLSARELLGPSSQVNETFRTIEPNMQRAIPRRLRRTH